MKKFKSILIALIAVCCFSIPAKAQFQWGVQAGIVANDLKFNTKIFDASNRVGFVGGVTAQFNLPLSFGIQASLNYVHRVTKVDIPSSVGGPSPIQEVTFKADYLSLPIHVKYNFGLPVVGTLLRPFIFTGPTFSYIISNNDGFGGMKKGDVEWDFGIGADIVKHVQLTVGYGIGCNKVFKNSGTNGRTNAWTITLGYLF